MTAPALNAERIARDVIVIGASAGGVGTLIEIFGGLAAALPAAILVVVHRNPVHEGRLRAVFGRRCRLPVVEPPDGERIEPGRIYLAPRDRHLLIEGHRVRLGHGPKEHHTRPAVDPLFTTAAASAGKRAVGVVLSGMGDDGVVGLIRIKAAGGISLVQHPAEAQFAAMPKNALVGDTVDAALPAEELMEAFDRLARGEPFIPRAASPARASA